MQNPHPKPKLNIQFYVTYLKNPSLNKGVILWHQHTVVPSLVPALARAQEGVAREGWLDKVALGRLLNGVRTKCVRDDVAEKTGEAKEADRNGT